jgi:SAM-dependent MidA family methyltransferase
VAEGRWLTWRVATERALYGDGGFYRRTAGPAAHFRTSVHASPLFARAVLALARATGLGTVVDVGSGRGELLVALHEIDPSLRLVGVEVADRPDRLPDDVAWTAQLPGDIEALVVANEWLDNIPVDVVELASDGPRLVEVDGRGEQRLGGRPSARDLDWLAAWWPLREVGDRAEVGHPRDDAWAAVVRGLRRGVAVGIDYAHRLGGRPPGGTLAGYRSGRQVPPVPDGSCDLTSHVALDACAAAGVAAGASATVLTSQRAALRALGLRGSRPALASAERDPAAYLAALAAAGEVAELTDPDGLGGFGWLVQAVGMSPHGAPAQRSSG